MKKKVLAVLLAAAMTVPVLAGCGGAPSTSGSSSAAGGSSAASSSAGGSGDAQAPAEMKKLRILGVDHSGTDGSGNTIKLSDWVNGDSKLWERFTADLAERGLELEVDLIEQDQYTTTVNNYLASNGLADYDWVYMPGLTADTRLKMVAEGKLQALNKIWNELSKPETKEFFEAGEGREVVKLNTLEDGNIYWVSTAIIGTYNGSYFGSFTTPMIRRDWLKKLGLEMPTSPDELVDVLKAFRDQDVNGNGEADEVASIGISYFGGGLAQLFGVGMDYVYQDYYTGKITSAWYDANVKEYIKYMNRLYSEGLLLDEAADVSPYAAENKLSMSYSWALETWDEPGILVPEGEAAPYYEPFMFKAVEGTEPLMARQGGIQKAAYDYGATDQADPQAVAIYLDYIASETYSTLSEFGIEGYSFEYGPNGELIQYTTTDINPNASISEVQFIVKTPALWVNNGIAPRVQRIDRKQEVDMTKSAGYEMGYPDEGFEDKVKLIRDIYENENKYSYAAMSMNVAYPTVQETEDAAKFNEDLNTRSTEILTNLIVGKEGYSLDQWDTYIKELQDMGLDKLIQLYQNRLDRASK